MSDLLTRARAVLNDFDRRTTLGHGESSVKHLRAAVADAERRLLTELLRARSGIKCLDFGRGDRALLDHLVGGGLVEIAEVPAVVVKVYRLTERGLEWLKNEQGEEMERMAES